VAENRLRLEGLTELRAAFQRLPREIQHEASVIVQAHAEEAKRRMAAAYPVRNYGRLRGRGNLRKGLTIESRYDVTSAYAIVRNRAQHAYLYEHGTKPRKWWTKSKKKVGVMPAGHVFIPIAIQTRRHMVFAIVDLVRRAGFDVSGF
jgi:Bacteriophage HK97-gp10, putative tail-component